MKYAIIASTFTGNLGGASMLEATVQTISAKDSRAEFFVFTVYPKQDFEANNYKNVRIVSAKPLTLALWINPLALLYRILPPLRGLFRRSVAIRVLSEADVLLDQGGVTFVKGRKIFIIYNVATLVPAILMRVPIIKCSQALGDFSTFLNRVFAKIFLPKMHHIFARGKYTLKHLKSIGLKNVSEAADYAFLLKVSKQNDNMAQKLLKDMVMELNGKTICIIPSRVVYKKAYKQMVDYVGIWQEFINQLVDDGFEVVLLPHSTRFNTNRPHNNDLPLCREIASGISSHKFHFIDRPLNAQQIRALIGRMDLLITSRFHGMVSGLATAVPSLVVGWSHKYQEVMDQFGLVGSTLSVSDLSLERLNEAFMAIFKNRRAIKKQIKQKLPSVQSSAEHQVLEILNSVKQPK